MIQRTGGATEHALGGRKKRETAMSKSRDLIWRGPKLYYRNRVIGSVVHRAYGSIGMWRAVRPDGRLTDMVNATRARDAAMGFAIASLNSTAHEAIRWPLARSTRQAA
jgi:hypothetical protein